MPRHVAIMIDGNRRWARAAGFDDVSQGHLVGARHIANLLDWCSEAGVDHVTIWLLSTDNLRRPAEELEPLLRIIAGVAERAVRARQAVAGQAVGALDLLPAETAEALKAAEERTAERRRAHGQHRGRLRRPARDRRRRALAAARARGAARHPIEELAEVIDVDHIAEHLYTKGQPDPDLVIRTSGEQRLGGLPALAVGALGVLLLRRALAGLPQDRLPARAARLRHAQQRRMTAHDFGPLVAGRLAGRAPATEVRLVDVRWYLDGRSGRDAYAAGHLPGAVWLDIDTDLSDPPARAGPPPAAGARALRRRAGPRRASRPATPVVAYDDAGGSVGGAAVVAAARARRAGRGARRRAGRLAGPAGDRRAGRPEPVDRATRGRGRRTGSSGPSRLRPHVPRRSSTRVPPTALRGRRPGDRSAAGPHPRARCSAPGRQPRRRRPLPQPGRAARAATPRPPGPAAPSPTAARG